MQPTHKRFLVHWLPLAALALALLTQTSLFRNTKSITFDEPRYLHGSLSAFWEGDFHPLSGLGVSPLPLLATYWLPAFDCCSAGSHPVPPMAPHTDAETSGVDRRLIDRARLVNSSLRGMTILCVVR